MTDLLFVVPIRHPAVMADPALERETLARTLRSIAAQDGGCWRAIVVASPGTDLPAMPEGCSVLWLDRPPIPRSRQLPRGHPERGQEVQLDKGRRILAALGAAPDARYVMPVDSDDLVSRRVAAFVSAHCCEAVGERGAGPGTEPPGWQVDRGYTWIVGSRHLMGLRPFWAHSGSGNIVLRRLLPIPDDPDTMGDQAVRDWLGGHRRLPRMLAAAGHRLAPLPFRGAVWTLGNPNSFGEARLRGSLRAELFGQEGRAAPGVVLRKLATTRPLMGRLIREFFGGARP